MMVCGVCVYVRARVCVCVLCVLTHVKSPTASPIQSSRDGY